MPTEVQKTQPLSQIPESHPNGPSAQYSYALPNTTLHTLSETHGTKGQHLPSTLRNAEPLVKPFFTYPKRPKP